MNHISIVGNIAEPKMSFTKTGKAVLTFGLATTRKVGDEKHTTWHTVKAWDEFAENLADEIQKGDRVVVIGRVEQEKWQDKDGNERITTVVVAEEAGRTLRWTRKGD